MAHGIVAKQKIDGVLNPTFTVPQPSGGSLMQGGMAVRPDKPKPFELDNDPNEHEFPFNVPSDT